MREKPWMNSEVIRLVEMVDNLRKQDIGLYPAIKQIQEHFPHRTFEGMVRIYDRARDPHKVWLMKIDRKNRGVKVIERKFGSDIYE